MSIRDFLRRLFIYEEAPGYVYLMRSNGLYKIGRSKRHPKNRLNDFVTGNPSIELVHYIRCSNMNQVEKELHRKYANKRVYRGKRKTEWFRLTSKDIRYIKGIR